MPPSPTIVLASAPRRLIAWFAAGLTFAVIAPVLLVIAVIAPVASTSARCPGGLSDDLAFGPGPGALGGVNGTGLTREEVRSVSRRGARHVTEGDFSTTSYGPPWGGIQGEGQATAGGLHLGGRSPRRYFVAVDPAVVPLGSWIWVQPNPFRWAGPFFTADTGGAIRGRRLDFYDWRGREQQLAWGRRVARISARPPGPTTTTVPVALPEGTAELGAFGGAGACSPAGVALDGSGSGREAVKFAVAFLGRNARAQAFARFVPGSTQLPWCAWFVTNLWKLAGVPIRVDFYSAFPLTWAQAGHPELIIKAPAQRARTLELPVGAALMYGSGPGDSDHVNLVRGRNPDGTIQIIGGNQGVSRVTTYGPCRLTNGAYVRLTGPGCDPRPIYAIVAPGDDTDDA